ncbi:MAG: 23S rRNA (uracil(1939)-C(5))-methyltransferase RlmD [Lachnospiraceae bacterium]|nr:23S rRNA (uracil(1939)-C(5))-methyltransferase RlmD [Lachnospiraceae bacterium]
MQKNDIIELKIEDITEQGEGIGKVSGYALFVKDTVPGDTVKAKVIKAKKSYGYAKLMEVLTPSADRVSPRCPAAGPCGGCQLQAMDYQAQLAFKRKKVGEHLRRIGGFEVLYDTDASLSGSAGENTVFVEPVLGMEEPWEYRNKFLVPVRKTRDGRIITGFYAGRTHSVIETPHCFLGEAVYDEILKSVRDFMSEYGIEPYEEASGKGVVRHVMIRKGKKTGQIMVCLVINRKKLPHADVLAERLSAVPGFVSFSLNVNTERNNVIMGDRIIPVYGEPWIEDLIGDVKYRISPLSFFQVNPEQTEKLYGKVLEYAALTGKETVWDLYCGTGTISLFLAREAGHVYGVEIVPEAIEDAEHNAAVNSIANASFFCGKAEEVMPELLHAGAEGTAAAEIAVVDPPRKGCDGTLLETLLAMRPAKIVYVSCDSATLARDLKILCGEGQYAVRKVQPVDMFPQSGGIETVVKLERNGL